MKLRLIPFVFILFTTFINAQNVYFPDPIFRSFMLGQYDINTNRDDEISVAEAEAFTGDLVAISDYFSDFTGIEAFVNLTGFNFSSVKITSLDISALKALKVLHCGHTQLENLDLSKNTALTNIYIFHNSQLTNLNISECKSLKLISCYTNKKLQSLDVSKNIALTTLFCFDNQLSSLNLKNGNNSLLSTMQSYGNPNLTCILVDDVNYANSANWQKDAQSSYSMNCSLSVNDTNKREVMLYPNPAKDLINFSEELSNVKISDVSGKTIKQINTTVKSIDVSRFAKGIYVISGTLRSGEVITKKIIKD